MTAPQLATVDEGPEADSLDDLLFGVSEIRKSLAEYKKAEQYFEGTRPESFSNKRYRQALERTGTSYRMNFAKTPVDSVTDRLDILSVTAIGGGDADVAIERMMEENQSDLEEYEIHKRACEFGDAYVLVWPNDEIEEDEEYESPSDEAAEDAFQAGKLGIDMYYNDPRTMRAFYDAENPRIMRVVVKMWEVYGGRWRVNLIYKDRIEKWISKKDHNIGRGERQGWQSYGDDVENVTGRIPVFHFRTQRPYGIPVHKDAYGPQDIITKLVVTHMTTIDYHGFPQRWAISGGDLDDGDEDTEEFGFGETPMSPMNDDVERDRSSLKSEPGHMWFLKNVKQVGQFSAADASTFLGPLETYISMMGNLTTTPLHHFDFKGNPPSGESLRVSEVRFIKKIQRIQQAFGATWKELWEYALSLLNIIASVKVDWANPSATNDQLSWDIAIMKRDLGIPIRQVLLDVGYTAKTLDDWKVPDAEWVLQPPPPPPMVPTKLPNVHINPLTPVGTIE